MIPWMTMVVVGWNENLVGKVIGPNAPAVLNVVLGVAVANIQMVFSSVHLWEVALTQVPMAV
jgi:hypothetical protein